MARDIVLKSARYLAADYLRRILLPGDIAVDATMGNGHDTLTLCELVGETGHVYAFDIQDQALMHTRAILEEAGMLARATLLHCSHAEMERWVGQAPQAVVFNLGWLPGGDKRITTRWDSTRQALEAALRLLTPGGICTLCLYPGHAEGARERDELLSFLAALAPQRYNALHQHFMNAGANAPECVIVQKF